MSTKRTKVYAWVSGGYGRLYDVNCCTSNPTLSRKEEAVSEWPEENTTVQAAQPLNMSESDMTTQEPQQQVPEEQHHRTE